jgi:hypothetical protein
LQERPTPFCGVLNDVKYVREKHDVGWPALPLRKVHRVPARDIEAKVLKCAYIATASAPIVQN